MYFFFSVLSKESHTWKLFWKLGGLLKEQKMQDEGQKLEEVRKQEGLLEMYYLHFTQVLYTSVGFAARFGYAATCQS